MLFEVFCSEIREGPQHIYVIEAENYDEAKQKVNEITGPRYSYIDEKNKEEYSVGYHVNIWEYNEKRR